MFSIVIDTDFISPFFYVRQPEGCLRLTPVFTSYTGLSSSKSLSSPSE